MSRPLLCVQKRKNGDRAKTININPFTIETRWIYIEIKKNKENKKKTETSMEPPEGSTLKSC